MAKQKLLVLVSAIAFSLGVGGCASLPFLGGGESTSDVAVEEGTVPPPEAVPSPSASPGQTPGQPNGAFQNPLVQGGAGKQPEAQGLIPVPTEQDLIKATQKPGRANPFATIPLANEQRQPVPKTRIPSLPNLPFNRVGVADRMPRPRIPNPFGSGIPVAPDRLPDRPDASRGPIAQSPNNNIPRANVPGGVPNIPPPPGSSFPPSALPPIAPPGSAPPTGEPSRPDFIPDLPSLPEPTLAQAVTVTGVVTVGGETRAIVQAPNESSRYVRPGDYLSNGQVLVKRIEMRGNAQPVVIFEELGIEVARAVGEQPAGASPESASVRINRPNT